MLETGKACQEQTHYLIMNIRKLKPQQKFYNISLRLNWLTDEKHSNLLLCSYNDNEKKFYELTPGGPTEPLPTTLTK